MAEAIQDILGKLPTDFNQANVADVGTLVDQLTALLPATPTDADIPLLVAINRLTETFDRNDIDQMNGALTAVRTILEAANASQEAAAAFPDTAAAEAAAERDRNEMRTKIVDMLADSNENAPTPATPVAAPQPPSAASAKPPDSPSSPSTPEPTPERPDETLEVLRSVFQDCTVEKNEEGKYILKNVNYFYSDNDTEVEFFNDTVRVKGSICLQKQQSIKLVQPSKRYVLQLQSTNGPENLELQGTTVEGDIRTVGDVSLHYGSSVNGSIINAKNIYLNHSSCILGNIEHVDILRVTSGTVQGNIHQIRQLVVFDEFHYNKDLSADEVQIFETPVIDCAIQAKSEFQLFDKTPSTESDKDFDYPFTNTLDPNVWWEFRNGQWTRRGSPATSTPDDSQPPPPPAAPASKPTRPARVRLTPPPPRPQRDNVKFFDSAELASKTKALEKKYNALLEERAEATDKVKARGVTTEEVRNLAIEALNKSQLASFTGISFRPALTVPGLPKTPTNSPEEKAVYLQLIKLADAFEALSSERKSILRNSKPCLVFDYSFSNQQTDDLVALREHFPFHPESLTTVRLGEIGNYPFSITWFLESVLPTTMEKPDYLNFREKESKSEAVRSSVRSLLSRITSSVEANAPDFKSNPLVMGKIERMERDLYQLLDPLCIPFEYFKLEIIKGRRIQDGTATRYKNDYLCLIDYEYLCSVSPRDFTLHIAQMVTEFEEGEKVMRENYNELQGETDRIADTLGIDPAPTVEAPSNADEDLTITKSSKPIQLSPSREAVRTKKDSLTRQIKDALVEIFKTNLRSTYQHGKTNASYLKSAYQGLQINFDYEAVRSEVEETITNASSAVANNETFDISRVRKIEDLSNTLYNLVETFRECSEYRRNVLLGSEFNYPVFTISFGHQRDHHSSVFSPSSYPVGTDVPSLEISTDLDKRDSIASLFDVIAQSRPADRLLPDPLPEEYNSYWFRARLSTSSVSLPQGTQVVFTNRNTQLNDPNNLDDSIQPNRITLPLEATFQSDFHILRETFLFFRTEIQASQETATALHEVATLSNNLLSVQERQKSMTRREYVSGLRSAAVFLADYERITSSGFDIPPMQRANLILDSNARTAYRRDSGDNSNIIFPPDFYSQDAQSIGNLKRHNIFYSALCEDPDNVHPARAALDYAWTNSQLSLLFESNPFVLTIRSVNLQRRTIAYPFETVKDDELVFAKAVIQGNIDETREEQKRNLLTLAPEARDEQESRNLRNITQEAANSRLLQILNYLETNGKIQEFRTIGSRFFAFPFEDLRTSTPHLPSFRSYVRPRKQISYADKLEEDAAELETNADKREEARVLKEQARAIRTSDHNKIFEHLEIDDPDDGDDLDLAETRYDSELTNNSNWTDNIPRHLTDKEWLRTIREHLSNPEDDMAHDFFRNLNLNNQAILEILALANDRFRLFAFLDQRDFRQEVRAELDHRPLIATFAGKEGFTEDEIRRCSTILDDELSKAALTSSIREMMGSNEAESTDDIAKRARQRVEEASKPLGLPVDHLQHQENQVLIHLSENSQLTSEQAEALILDHLPAAYRALQTQDFEPEFGATLTLPDLTENESYEAHHNLQAVVGLREGLPMVARTLEIPVDHVLPSLRVHRVEVRNTPNIQIVEGILYIPVGIHAALVPQAILKYYQIAYKNGEIGDNLIARGIDTSELTELDSLEVHGAIRQYHFRDAPETPIAIDQIDNSEDRLRRERRNTQPYLSSSLEFAIRHPSSVPTIGTDICYALTHEDVTWNASAFLTHTLEVYGEDQYKKFLKAGLILAKLTRGALDYDLRRPYDRSDLANELELNNTASANGVILENMDIATLRAEHLTEIDQLTGTADEIRAASYGIMLGLLHGLPLIGEQLECVEAFDAYLYETQSSARGKLCSVERYTQGNELRGMNAIIEHNQRSTQILGYSVRPLDPSSNLTQHLTGFQRYFGGRLEDSDMQILQICEGMFEELGTDEIEIYLNTFVSNPALQVGLTTLDMVVLRVMRAIFYRRKQSEVSRRLEITYNPENLKIDSVAMWRNTLGFQNQIDTFLVGEGQKPTPPQRNNAKNFLMHLLYRVADMKLGRDEHSKLAYATKTYTHAMSMTKCESCFSTTIFLDPTYREELRSIPSLSFEQDRIIESLTGIAASTEGSVDKALAVTRPLAVKLSCGSLNTDISRTKESIYNALARIQAELNELHYVEKSGDKQASKNFIDSDEYRSEMQASLGPSTVRWMYEHKDIQGKSFVQLGHLKDMVNEILSSIPSMPTAHEAVTLLTYARGLLDIINQAIERNPIAKTQNRVKICYEFADECDKGWDTVQREASVVEVEQEGTAASTGPLFEELGKAAGNGTMNAVQKALGQKTEGGTQYTGTIVAALKKHDWGTVATGAAAIAVELGTQVALTRGIGLVTGTTPRLVMSLGRGLKAIAGAPVKLPWQAAKKASTWFRRSK